jgi:putative hydrolase of the HAD superfamily
MPHFLHIYILTICITYQKMHSMIKLIGLDFDETRAATEKHFRDAEKDFFTLLARQGAQPSQLDAVQRNFSGINARNIRVTGFGVGAHLKTFVDTALEFVPEIVDAQLLSGIKTITEELREKPAEIFDEAREFMIRAHALGARLADITKGEVFHQRDKLQRFAAFMGKDDVPRRTYILGNKSGADYLDVLYAERIEPKEFVMIGDSDKSDVLAVLGIGGHAIHLARPSGQSVQWAFEKAQLPPDVTRVESLAEAADALEKLVRKENAPATPTPTLRGPC